MSLVLGFRNPGPRSWHSPTQCEVFGLDVELNVASDYKRAAREFAQANHSFKHVVSSAEDHAYSQAKKCDVHQTSCGLPNQVDLLVTGLPCHPFSKQRHKVPGSGGRTGAPEEHEEFSIVFETFPEYLTLVAPLGFVVEETEGLLQTSPSGERWLDMLIAMIDKAGYDCNALLLDSNTWINWPRSRIDSLQSPWALGFL